MSELNLTDEQTQPAAFTAPQQQAPKEGFLGARLCAWILGLLLASGCIAGLFLMAWSFRNEKDGPRLFYAVSPVTFLLFSSLIQFLLFEMQSSPSKRPEPKQALERQFRLDPKVLTVGFALGVSVSLMHVLGSLVLKILALQPATSPYQAFHEGVLATVAVGVLGIIGFLAHRMSHLDD
jgi:MFS family permease